MSVPRIDSCVGACAVSKWTSRLGLNLQSVEVVDSGREKELRSRLDHHAAIRARHEIVGLVGFEIQASCVDMLGEYSWSSVSSANCTEA